MFEAARQTLEHTGDVNTKATVLRLTRLHVERRLKRFDEASAKILQGSTKLLSTYVEVSSASRLSRRPAGRCGKLRFEGHRRLHKQRSPTPLRLRIL